MSAMAQRDMVGMGCDGSSRWELRYAAAAASCAAVLAGLVMAKLLVRSYGL
jgi:hypothetical protein